MRQLSRVLLMGLLFLMVGCGDAAEPVEYVAVAETAVAPSEADPILSMPTGWTKIEPGGDTRCAHDTDFAFWVRPGNVNKLLVYFQGGGGCWNGDTCQANSGYYDDSVSELDSPEPRGGIFNFDNPDNPFADYHAVYVPSCTGDVYMGSQVKRYETSGGKEMEIYHHGFINLSAAINWAFEHVLTPDSVFITGCSAGSVGSIVAAPHLIRHYAEADIAQLGDSLGFVFAEPTAVDSFYGISASFPDWMPAFANVDPDAFVMADFYNIVAATYPNVRFAQYNTEADRVQVRYHLAGGETAESFPATLANALTAVHAESPNFRSYHADGTVHCIMPSTDFYAREVAGVRFRDWVAELAEGNDVPNVQCAGCGVTYGDD